MAKENKYCNLVKDTFTWKVEGKTLVYNLGSYYQKGLGRIDIRISVSNSFFISFEADVKKVDVPLLFEIYILTSSRLVLDFWMNKYVIRLEIGHFL